MTDAGAAAPNEIDDMHGGQRSGRAENARTTWWTRRSGGALAKHPLGLLSPYQLVKPGMSVATGSADHW